MKQTNNTNIVRDIVKLGVEPANAWRIVNKSKGHAAKALVRLITDLHARGINVVRD
jgi:hypothetical protein